jgi:transcription elongation factor Elf1
MHIDLTLTQFLPDLSEAIDVYGDWIDACESANT